MRTLLIVLAIIAVAVLGYFSLDRDHPVRLRIDAALGLAQSPAEPTVDSLPSAALTEPTAAEVACARKLAGPSAEACTAESCKDPLAAAGDGPCVDFCAQLNSRPLHTPIARNDCRYRLARRQWPPSGEEVIGAEPAPEGKYQATVVISKTLSSTDPLCSGALISDSVVLTAKHCFEKLIAVPGAFVHFGRSLAAATEASAALVSEVKLPDERVAELAKLDIALLKLDRARPAGVHKMTVANEVMIDATGLIRVVGFGLTEKGKAGDRNYTDVLVVSHKCDQSDAGKPDSEYFGCIPGVEMVAAVKERDKDTCPGDSGGPALVASAGIANLPDPNQRTSRFREDMDAGNYFLAGVTSESVAGDIPPRKLTFHGQSVECGSGGRYVRLSGAALAWIDESVRAWQGEAITVAP